MIAIIVDVSVVMNNKMNGICSMNEKPEMHVLFLVKKKKSHRSKQPGIPVCRQLAE
jgi:hypothetical protein